MNARSCCLLIVALFGCATVPPVVQEQLARELAERAGTAIQGEMIGDSTGPGEPRPGTESAAPDAEGEPGPVRGSLAEDIRCASSPGDCPADAGGEVAEPIDPTYDFEPGDRVLFEHDGRDAPHGALPAGIEPLGGSWDLVERDGRQWLRNTGPRRAAVAITLPEALPESFTIEFELLLSDENQRLVVTTTRPDGAGLLPPPGNAFQIGASGVRTGITASGGGPYPESLGVSPEVARDPTPIRIMVDGSRASLYAGTRPVARVVEGAFERGSTVFLENAYFASETNPVLIGPIRIAVRGIDDEGGLR